MFSSPHLVEQATRFQPGIVDSKIDQGFECRAKRLAAFQNFEHICEYPLGVAIKGRQCQPVFIAEHTIERWFRDAGHLADGVHGHIGRIGALVGADRHIQHAVHTHRAGASARGFFGVVHHYVTAWYFIDDFALFTFVPLGIKRGKRCFASTWITRVRLQLQKMEHHMSTTLVSTLGLLLCLAPAIVHGAEISRPLWARWIVNWVLPVFGPGLPQPSKFLTAQDQTDMLDAALSAVPAEKSQPGQDYVFLMLFEQRQGALAFIAVAVGVLYGLTLPMADRHALHLVFGVMAALFTLVNANHAGVPLLGHHPKVSRNGRHVGLVFTPFWAATTVLNILSFAAATAATN
jgi:hypothetical protein